MCKGLPASGKSTWAKEQQAKRINKDDLRAMFDNSKWSSYNEKFVLKMRDLLIVEALLGGNNVIVDDTNLHPKHETRLKQLAKENKCGFEIKDFTDVPVEECIKRDLKRSNSVGEKVIRDMYNQFLKRKEEQYVPDKTLLKAFIFDIDGTLAIMGNRSPFEWSKVGLDTLNKPVYDVLWALLSNNEIIIVSGRDSVCRKETEKWLSDNKISYTELHMRPEGNNEKDSIIKKRIFDDIKTRYNILGVFDDRNQVVEMWRSLGLTCFQVADGNF